MNKRWDRAAALVVFILAVFPNSATAQTGETYENAQVVDRIAAVVGDEIILLSEVQRQVSAQMMAENMDENTSSQVLQRLLSDVLNEMVNESLLLVKAAQDSIELDPTTIRELEKQQFAALRNQYQSDEEFTQSLADFGITEPQIRYMIREMMVKNQLQEQILQNTMRGITVTPQDLEAWVVANRDSIGEMPAQYRLSHILRYSQVSESRKAQILEKLQGIREHIMNGEDFAELARQYSEDPGSREGGGDLGYFNRGMMVPEFAQEAFSLEVGEVSDIVETQFGYHLIKAEDIRGDQISARHILLLLQPTEADNQETIAFLNRIRDDINAGRATFEDMARQYSEDENSSSLGGRLQWLTSDDAIPSFIEQADKMRVGDISMLFKSQFGYHLLRLDNFRPAHQINLKDDSQIIRQIVMNEKSMAELDRILDKLRAETYIRLSLE